MRLHSAVPLLLPLLFGAGLAAQEPIPQEPNADANDPFGHSRHGAEFDEGPRQAAYLMEGLGDQVHFPVAGLSAEAQAFFDQGVTQQHGFWYYEAERSFRQVAMLQPDCAMAYWGMTVANIDLPERAAGFIANAVEREREVPQRERLWIDAWAGYFGIDDAVRSELWSGEPERVAAAKKALTERAAKGPDKAAKTKRDRQLLKDLGTLVYEFPDDIEAKAFLAIQNWHAYAWGSGIEIVSHTAIDALIDQVLAQKPMHPAHHYRIHLWDREDARRSLASAARIGASAPAIAHQWHMAGHIYDKLHRHAEAAWQQEASSRADHAHMQRDRVMPFQIHNYGHNQEWTCRSLSHVGRWQEALQLAKNMAELPRHPTKNRPDEASDIAGYAQQRLVSVCEDHELWSQAVELCRAGYFAGGDVRSEAMRLGLLGRALFRLGRDGEAEAVIAEVDELLVRARRERADKLDAAEDAAVAAAKERKEIDEALAGAQRAGTDLVRLVLDLQRELRGERLLRDGDAVAALAEFETVRGLPKTLLAGARIAAGKADEAVALLAEEVKKNPGRVPTLRGLIAAHRAAAGPEAADRIAELEAALAAIPKGIADFGADFGERPPLAALGPFRWQPTAAPPLELEIAGADGARFDLAASRQPTLVVFYLGFGCLHCIEQLQAIGPKAGDFAAAGIRVVAIGTDPAEKAAKSLAALTPEERFPFPLLADPGQAAFRAWRCYDDFEAMPLHGTFLVDGEGRVRWQDISYEPFTAIDWLLAESQRLLALPAAAGAGSK
ncbi:MAG: redoxin domain-containing protein [Planctomycetes bacterium]|nr:redoxin domain-containing protein [Planctomycetota bacterium]